ncbi:MAG: DNA methyltransferase [Saprospiraceae bacterium]
MGKFILGDCMHPEYGLPSYPDKFIDLAIVDPPYGINIHKKQKAFSGVRNYHVGEFDAKRPEKEYFEEIDRVCKNWIIWGANYFSDLLPPVKCFIFWDKHNSNIGKFADGELAYCSFNSPARLLKAPWLRWWQPDMKNKETRIHPTQKPIALYRWLLENYAKPGDLILDTHVGSASSLIAFEQMKFDYVGFEIDEDYYKAAQDRMDKGIQQLIF